jgi:hypothetical protein
MKNLSPLAFILTLGFSTVTLVNAATPKVIYGEDNRVFATESNNEQYKLLAASTAVQLKDKKLTLSEDGKTYKLNQEKLKDSFIEVCEDEKFADVINAGNCSGFLVGPDLLVTAGHCMRSKYDCNGGKWAFNYQMANLGVDSEIAASEVYGCKEILSQELSNSSKNDFALIKLDRVVTEDMDDHPLKLVLVNLK